MFVVAVFLTFDWLFSFYNSSTVNAADSLTKSEQSSSAGENVQKSAFPNGFEVHNATLF